MKRKKFLEKEQQGKGHEIALGEHHLILNSEVNNELLAHQSSPKGFKNSYKLSANYVR